MELFLNIDVWVALLTLTFLEIILGIDNIIFISISANKLPKEQQKKATMLGLSLAMIIRILLLFSISYLIALKDPFIIINNSWLETGITGQSIILLLGGLFLLYKNSFLQFLYGAQELFTLNPFKSFWIQFSFLICLGNLNILLSSFLIHFVSLLL